MDFGQILKFLIEAAPYAIPAVPFIPFYFWLRKTQDELAEKNMDIDEAMRLLSGASLAIEEQVVVRISEPAPAYKVKIPHLFTHDTRAEYLLNLYIHREKFLDKIDRLFGGPIIKLAPALVALCSILMFIFELPKSLLIFMGVISMLLAFLAYSLYSGWLIDIKRAFVKLREANPA